MFDNYEDIFNKRGNEYNLAMTRYPAARKEEFINLINLLDLRNGDHLIDIPSGGCYLRNFIDKNMHITFVDSSQVFLSYCDEKDNVVCSDITHTPLAGGTFDKVHSLAGIHHLRDKTEFYREAARLLKKGGIIALADVEKGSMTDPFLNVFVDSYNSMGHKGDFLVKEEVIAAMNNCGLEVKQAIPVRHYWRFVSEEEMVDFTKNLFGLDMATDEEVLKGIKHYAGYEPDAHGIKMSWELLYFQAIRM